MEVELKAKTLGATLGYLAPETPVDTLADTCTSGGQDCWQETMKVKAKGLLYRQTDTIR